MPIKFTKDITTHLIKYVNKINVTYNPFDARTTSARELLRQVYADRFKAANPKLEISSTMTDKAQGPRVDFHFVDNSELNYESEYFNTKEMLHGVYMKAMQLNIEFELEGKNIEEMV